MKIVFCSNYMNHHQEEMACEFHKLLGENYSFIACTPFNKKRLKLGYEDMNKKYDFIICPYEDKEQKRKAEEIVRDCDVLIFGAGDEKYFKIRMKTGKLTFRYSERLLKRGLFMRYIPLKILRTYNRFVKYKNNKNLHILCSSAYTAYDLSLFGFGEDKYFKWGYFPPVNQYEDIDNLISNKKKNEIVWTGRFLGLKHPEAAVDVAERLKNDGIKFHLTMIGDGKKMPYIRRLVKRKNLTDNITLTGSVSANDVRRYMEEAEIFLFTSDFHEGWGAVLNEGMNSGCVCVASHAIGSVPFLIEDGKNGFIYENGNDLDLYEKVKYLLKNPDDNIGKTAYETMTTTWNAKESVKRLISLIKDLQNNKAEFQNIDVPCSKAQIIKNSWYSD